MKVRGWINHFIYHKENTVSFTQTSNQYGDIQENILNRNSYPNISVLTPVIFHSICISVTCVTHWQQIIIRSLLGRVAVEYAIHWENSFFIHNTFIHTQKRWEQHKKVGCCTLGIFLFCTDNTYEKRCQGECMISFGRNSSKMTSSDSLPYIYIYMKKSRKTDREFFRGYIQLSLIRWKVKSQNMLKRGSSFSRDKLERFIVKLVFCCIELKDMNVIPGYICLNFHIFFRVLKWIE